MTLTIAELAGFLGQPAEVLQAAPPFSEWTFRRSVETDPDVPRIYYECEREGIDFTCDKYDRVTTIFLHGSDSRKFNIPLQDVHFAMSRQEVLDRFGSPSKSGGRTSHPILGKSGPWDRFVRDGYVLHFRFRDGADAIELTTLMRPDVVP